MLFVVFTVGLVTGTDLPYALAKTVVGSSAQIVRPAHLLAAAALFMVILAETGRIPVETHTGTNEFGMIEEARPFEYSGPYLALLRWGSTMKQLILFVILINVFVAPWGLASEATLVAVGFGDPGAAGQVGRARRRDRGDRRLVRQTSAVQDHRVRGGGVHARRSRGRHVVPRGWMMALPLAQVAGAPPSYAGVTNALAVLMLVIEFGMLQATLVRNQIRLYAAQSVVISVLAVVVAIGLERARPAARWPGSRWR